MTEFGPDLFVKRPVLIKAVYWDGTAEMAEFVVQHYGPAVVSFENDHLTVMTIEGPLMLNLGWTGRIVQGVENEVYPIKESVFRSTYGRWLPGDGHPPLVIGHPTVAPFNIPITAEKVQEVWDAYVKPKQRAGMQDSDDLALMAILRAVYSALCVIPSLAPVDTPPAGGLG